MTWLYSGRLAIGHVKFDDLDERKSTVPNELYRKKIMAYTLGDRRLATEFRCAVNNAVVDQAEKGPYLTIEDFYAIVQDAFEQVPADMTILEMLVDLNCRCCNDGFESPGQGDDARDRDELLQAFIWRTMHAFRVRELGKRSDCCFYEHVNEGEKKICEQESKQKHIPYNVRTGLPETDSLDG